MLYGIIYVITNIVNGKQYVGQTVGTLLRRWSFHLRYAKTGVGNVLHAAIRKYGEDSFSVEKIAEAFSREDLDKMEIFFIAQLSTMSPNGYNLTPGGYGRRGFIPSKETRLKQSLSMSGRSFSEEHRQKISKAKLGKHLSKEHRLKLSSGETCRQHHIRNIVTVYAPKNGGKLCLVCFYLVTGRKLPFHLQEYATLEELRLNKLKIRLTKSVRQELQESNLDAHLLSTHK